MLATLAAREPDALVVSGDTDLLQVAKGGVRVLFVGRRARGHVLYDASAVRKRYGVAPGQVPAWQALFVPLPEEPVVPLGDFTGLRALFETLEFASLLPRLDALC